MKKPKPIHQCVYVGKAPELRRKTALVQWKEGNTVLAQFDDIYLDYQGKALGFGWHEFQLADFRRMT
jgi:hypothetical protein